MRRSWPWTWLLMLPVQLSWKRNREQVFGFNPSFSSDAIMTKIYQLNIGGKIFLINSLGVSEVRFYIFGLNQNLWHRRIPSCKQNWRDINLLLIFVYFLCFLQSDSNHLAFHYTVLVRESWSLSPLFRYVFHEWLSLNIF